jgi:purine-binding chemotaxis protein CheW
MRWLSFKIGGELFAVDVTTIQKVVRNMGYTPVPAAPRGIVGIANLKGKVVTLLDLATMDGRQSGAAGWRSARLVNAVVFKTFMDDGNQMGLRIDTPRGLIESDEVLPIPLETDDRDRDREYLSGLALVDEMLYRLIDVDAIIARFTSEA